ncbi:hypothetical protein Zm00014a_003185 [Zea mays]|uniref:WAT1-related protein n=1 Tax=Zea mays TaxID=4577 RepID=A0A3L6E5L6_MAIZE|nr:hypothetical protein Zm00014a_026015 [Zea mays]PWZ10933.1 hypothetical protein Zm00014a_026015 [Zea mays]PWZ16168.1 hypothetical protein Zm00014a_003185 [Zea mays]PWZ16169.1 hypothetical protein Zm00014a_003185 [Zea mays]
MGATESGAVALVMERDTKAWSIGFDMRLFTAILGSFILSEVVTLGRLIGATVIVVGLYALIWGKNKDHVKSQNSFDKHDTFAAVLYFCR